MKAALIYTSTTPELIELVEHEVSNQLGAGTVILSYEDSSILAEVREAGYVTSKAAARLVTMYMKAVQDGADAILNICSSVGEVADAAAPIGKYIGIPIVRIDEEMCKDAVRLAAGRHGKIGVIATLPTTLEPTKNTIKRVARELGQQVVLVDGLVDAFGADRERFRSLMLEKAAELASEADVLLLCQGSMAYCEELLAQTLGLPVVSSPRYGARALKEALKAKGLTLE